MTTDTERTADQIHALTPSECWDIYVGDQTPEDFMRDAVNSRESEVGMYVLQSPMCADITDGRVRRAVADKLVEYIKADQSR